MIQVFNKKIMRVFLYLIVNLVTIFILVSCENVEDGYETNYGVSSADFTVEITTSDRGSKNDVAVFSIKVNSEYEIKSLVVTSTTSGADGTGFVVDSSVTDPLVDHIFGTIQPGTTSFSLEYEYVFPSDTVENTITFTLIDDEGKAQLAFDLNGIPDLTAYDGVELVAQSSTLLDAFSTSDGVVYEDVAAYDELTTANLAIQESIDLAFVVSDDNLTKIFAPYNTSYFGADFSNANKTVFKRLNDLSSADFDALTNISLSEITENYAVKKGSTVIDSVKVGDIIGFRTDYASTNPYHYGILRVNAIHPTNVDRYEGTSYLLEFDVLIQQE